MSDDALIVGSACPVATERLYLLAQVRQLVPSLGVIGARKQVVQNFMAAEYALQHVKKLSWQTLARWADMQANGISLSPRHKNAGRSSQIGEGQLYQIIGLKTQNPHLTWAKIAARSPDEDGVIPMASAARRAFENFKQRHPDQVVRLTNPAEYRNGYQVHMGSYAPLAPHANALIELDSTPIDCRGANGKRYQLMAAIDVYSRRMIVKVAKTSNAGGIKTLLRRVFVEFGVPEIVKTDNGRDYKSNEVQAALQALGVEQRFCKARSPWQKPYIERGLKTLNHDLAVDLPGFLGHSVQDQVARREREAAKKKERNRFLDKVARLFGVYVDNGLTISQLQAVIDGWCDREMDRPRKKSLNGKTPRMMLSGARVQKVKSERDLDILLSDLGGKDGIRTVQPTGIMLERGTFICPDVGRWSRQKVRIKHDPLEESLLHVFDMQWNFLFTAYNAALDGLKRRETQAKGRVIQQAIGNALDKQIAALQDERKRNNRKDHSADIRVANNQAEANDNVAYLPMRVEDYRGGAVGQIAAQKVAPEETGAQKYARWQALDRRIAAGEVVSESERVFWQKFPQNPQFKVQARKYRSWA